MFTSVTREQYLFLNKIYSWHMDTSIPSCSVLHEFPVTSTYIIRQRLVPELSKCQTSPQRQHLFCTWNKNLQCKCTTLTLHIEIIQVHMPLQLPLLTLCIPHLTYQAVTLPPSTWHTPVQSHSLTPLSAAPGHHKGVLCWPPSFPSSTGPYPLHYSRAGDPISSPPQHAAWPCCWLSSDTTGHGPANKWNSTRTSLNRTYVK